MTRQPTDSVAQDQIRAFVERVERLHEERVSIGDDIKEVFAEAKGNGLDVKALKIVIGKRRQDHNERMELEAVVELYEAALGMRGTSWDHDEDGVPGRKNGVPAGAPARAKTVPSHSEPVHVADLQRRGGAGALDSAAGNQSTEAGTDRRDNSTEASGHGQRLDPEAAITPPAGTFPPVDTNSPPSASPSDLSLAEQRRGATKPEADGLIAVAPGTKGAPTNSVAPHAADTEGLPALTTTEGAEHINDASSVVPFKRQWKQSDKPHADCLKPDLCGGYSNVKLCQPCREAAVQGQVA